MMDRSDAGSGFSVLDGAALVSGAAVASVHIRGVMRAGLAIPGWALIWAAFAWTAVTASGPFVYLVRRHARKLADYPKVGDLLWVLLGLPWLVAAVVRSAESERTSDQDPLSGLILSVGLWLTSLVALAVLLRSWGSVDPDTAERVSSGPWTNRVGLILAVAWPIQCGIGLVVNGG